MNSPTSLLATFPLHCGAAACGRPPGGHSDGGPGGSWPPRGSASCSCGVSNGWPSSGPADAT